MYLPKSKYTVKQAPWKMFTLSGSQDDEFYVGPYIEDFRGNYYAGTTIVGAENRVLEKIGENFKEPTQIRVDIIPGEKQYAAGSVVRYFRQNRTSKVVEEIDEEKARKSEGWKVISGSWILTGSLEDQNIYGHTYLGVKSRNQKTLNFWEKEIPGITEALNLKPEDFYQNL